MTLKALMSADVATFLNTNDFADTITLTHPAGVSGLTTNQMRSLFGLPAEPDGTIDAADARQYLGYFRFNDAESTEEEIAAIVDFDNLDAIQGMGLDTEFGRRIEEFGVLELSADVSFTFDEEKPERCTFATISGERWSCIRQIGKDSAMQTVAILRQNKIASRKTRPRA